MLKEDAIDSLTTLPNFFVRCVSSEAHYPRTPVLGTNIQ